MTLVCRLEKPIRFPSKLFFHRIIFSDFFALFRLLVESIVRYQIKPKHPQNIQLTNTLSKVNNNRIHIECETKHALIINVWSFKLVSNFILHFNVHKYTKLSSCTFTYYLLNI